MPKYTVREIYTKSDVWYDVKAKNEEEAIKYPYKDSKLHLEMKE